MAIVRLLRRPPPVADRRARAEALGVLLVAGGLLALAVVAVGGDRNLEQPVLLAVGVSALLIALPLLRLAPRVPRSLCHLVLASGSGAVVLVGMATGEATLTMAVGLPLIWVALYAGYFFSSAAAAAHLLLGLGLYGLVLGRLEQPVAVELLMLAAVAVTVTGVSGWLAQHRRLADVDPVTGVLNRRGFTRCLETVMAVVERDPAPLTVAILDIDHFRRVNERHGHEHGDRLLATCAQRWQRCLPNGASLARLGGDEFVVLLPDTSPSRTRSILEELRSHTPDGHSCSAGVAPWNPGDTQSMLLGRAETALYEAKRGGRDRVHVLGDDAALGDDLWQAVERDQLIVHYQPIFSLDTDALRGVEALVRWDHPDRGLLSPGVFLPAAEDSGAIHLIDRWVLTEACRQVRSWQGVADCGEELLVTVNASPSRLRDPRLIADVRAALNASQLRADCLVLEITEGALQGDIEAAAAVLWELRSLGVHLAIDDFGTGHSSLARLRGLPFDVLKIDRSFVSALGSERGAESLLSAILGMADSLELTTVAEGVEEEAQLALLRSQGCVHAQGYLLGRPVPGEELESRLPGLAAPVVAEAAVADHGDDLGDVVADHLGREAVEDLVRPLLAQVVRATGLEAAYVTWIDWEASKQRVWVTHGGLQVGIGEGDVVPWQDSVCHRALLEGPRATSDAPKDLPAPVMDELELRTYVVAPVSLTDGRLYGTLCATSTSSRPIEAATERLLELVARMIADHVESVGVRS